MKNRLRAITATEKMFLDSALSEESLYSLDQFFSWFEERGRAHKFEVVKVPLRKLRGWRVEQETGNIVHQSGKFFRIEGVDVRTNFGKTPHWMQPIIVQPEVGILGFLTMKIGGVLHFLVQAKMEPGNVNKLQVSPTVQATQSNYTQVHGGMRPPYLDYFIERSRSRFLVDQLQSEQGSRFLRKRNRNMIVEIAETEQLETHEDFFWLTLRQLCELLKRENLVNMDSRTILSCIRFDTEGEDVDRLFTGSSNPGFDEAVLRSSLASESQSVNDFDSIVSWLTHMKTQYQLQVRSVNLNQVEDWVHKDGEIKHISGRYFSIIGVSVSASSREVQGWDQPIIESVKGGILCFLCRKKDGVLHILVQGRVEPGNLDCVEMAPTLQCTAANYDSDNPEHFPPFYGLLMNARSNQIRYSVLQSEEGGRFYHDQNRYTIIEVDEDQEVELPDNYIWMTIRQAKEFIRFNNYFNIEARGLLSCLGLR